MSATISEEKSTTAVSPLNSVTLRIARYNPKKDSQTTFMDFKVPYEKWTTVLDVILEVKKHFDHSVAVRYSCRQATR